MKRFLKTKVGLVERPGGKHIHFDYLDADGGVIFPQITKLSHAPGDITPLMFGSTARGLGLNERDLTTSVNCSIKRECVLLCFCMRRISECYLKYVQDHEMDFLTYNDDMTLGLANSINTVLEDVRRNSQAKWNKHEISSLTREAERLKNIGDSQQSILAPLVTSVLSLIQEKS